MTTKTGTLKHQFAQAVAKQSQVDEAVDFDTFEYVATCGDITLRFPLALTLKQVAQFREATTVADDQQDAMFLNFLRNNDYGQTADGLENLPTFVVGKVLRAWWVKIEEAQEIALGE